MSRYGGYSGQGTIPFDLERYEDSDTKILYNEVDFNRSDPNKEFQLKLIELKVYGNAYFDPGCYSRLPEDCYPDDSDVEIGKIFAGEHEFTGTLTDLEISEIKELLIEAAKNGEL